MNDQNLRIEPSDTSEEAGWPSPSTGWYAVAVLASAQAFSGLDRNILNILVDPIKADLGATDTQMGLLLGFAFAIFYTSMALPMGRLADRMVRKTVIAVGMLSWCMATAACGFVWNYAGLFVTRMTVGIGEAALNPAAFSLISDYFSPKRRASPLSAFVGSQSIGSAVAIFMGGAIIQYFATHDVHVVIPFWGELRAWQVAFLCAAIPGFLVALLVLTIKEPPRRNVLAPGVADHVGKHASVGEVARHLWSNAGIYVPLFGSLGVLMFVELGRGAWLPSFFIRSLHFAPADVGITLGLIYLIVPPFSVAFTSWFSNRFLRPRAFSANMTFTVFAILATLPCGVGAFLMPSASLSVALMIPNSFLLIFPLVVAPSAIALVAPNRVRAQVTAVYLLSINLIGYGIGPAFIGFLTDTFFTQPGGVRYSIATAAAIGLPVSALFLWFAARKVKQVSDASPVAM